MGHNAAFSWNGKGQATLRSLTCDCGEEIISDVDDFVQCDSDSENIKCPACPIEYSAEFLVKLMPIEPEDGASNELDSPTRLILNAQEGDRVRVFYTSSISKNVKDIVGEVIETDRGLWCKIEAEENLTADEGDVYEVFGNELSDKNEGEVDKNGRKVGEFERAERE